MSHIGKLWKQKYHFIYGYTLEGHDHVWYRGSFCVRMQKANWTNLFVLKYIYIYREVYKYFIINELAIVSERKKKYTVKSKFKTRSNG